MLTKSIHILSGGVEILSNVVEIVDKVVEALIKGVGIQPNPNNPIMTVGANRSCLQPLTNLASCPLSVSMAHSAAQIKLELPHD